MHLACHIQIKSEFPYKFTNRIAGVMVSVIASNVVEKN